MDTEELRTLWAERDRRYREHRSGAKPRSGRAATMALTTDECLAIREYRLSEVGLLPAGARSELRAEVWRWGPPAAFR
jgi:hypothetical protein